MDVFRTVTTPEQYGPLQAGFQYDLRKGLSVLVGPNNAGKSALLQMLFRFLMGDESAAGPERIALILTDRDYVQTTAESGGRVLRAWNADLLGQLGGAPLGYAEAPTGPSRSQLATVLMHGSLSPSSRRSMSCWCALALSRSRSVRANRSFSKMCLYTFRGRACVAFSRSWLR
jgi:hypothetical protein